MSITINGTTGIAGVDGSAATPSVQGADANTGVFFPAADTVAITTGGTERMRVDSSGNVGIGTSSPDGKIDIQMSSMDVVAGLGGNYPMWTYRNGSGSWFHAGKSPSADAFVITTGATPVTTEYMRIDASGNVGIGTTAPGAKLDVTNNQAALSYLIDTNNTTNGGSSIWRMITRNIANTGTTSVEFYKPTGSGFSLLNNDTNGSNFTAFNVGASERMRIDSNGKVLVGRTTAYTDGSIGTPVFQSTSSTGAFAGGAFISSSTSATTQIGFVNPNGTVGSISSTGTATAYTTSSDYRLKENVQPMVGALDTIAQLNPVTYNWKVDGSDGQGFIAHELQAVVPDCVSGEKDAVDDEGRPRYQGVDTSFLVATLVKAVQEQQAIITALEARIAALEAK